MVGHKQKTLVLRQLFRPAHMYAHVAVKAAQLAAVADKGAAERILLLPRPARVDEQAHDRGAEDEQRRKREEGQREGKRALPQFRGSELREQAVGDGAKEREDRDDAHQHNADSFSNMITVLLYTSRLPFSKPFSHSLQILCNPPRACRSFRCKLTSFVIKCLYGYYAHYIRIKENRHEIYHVSRPGHHLLALHPL